jgi:tRNA (guanine-N(7)-)-methyltransferase subunit TRM82
MAHPFQRLSYSPPNSSRSQGVIFAASGPKILSFSALDGSFLSEWSAFPQSTSLKRASNEDQEHIVDNQSAHSRSSKKRLKLFSGSSHDTSLEVIIDNGGKKPKPKTPKAVLLPSVIRLCGTSDGEHIIALTGEDKCVRVFNVSHDGSLTQLSERYDLLLIFIFLLI